MTTEEITKQWLLTTAIDFPCRLGHIFPAVEGLALNMKDVPGCGPEDYSKGLLALLDAGMIRFSSKVPTHYVDTRAGVCNILDRLLSLNESDPSARIVRYLRRGAAKPAEVIVRDPALYVTFELTASGGEAWEKHAEPDWAHFFGELSDYEKGELISADLTLIMARMGWFPELADQKIQTKTINVEVLLDHQVLYWKRLPRVYRATFSCEQSDPRWENGHNLEPKWFRDWRHATTTWYKHPWELTGWPSK
jgi:hypothetical protein